MCCPYSHLIWDFNGTLLDDVLHGINCVNPMLAARGLPILPDVEAYRAAFGFPIEDYYRRLGFDFEREDYKTVLAPEWVKHYLAGEASCPLMPGAADTVRAVSAKGIPQLVLSASDQGMLSQQLTRLGLLDAFVEVRGLDNIHAHSKVGLAQAWREANPQATPLLVGDTEHDADVAAAIGADCVLYTGGHQSRARLAACGVRLVDSLTEILDLLP